MKHTLCVTVINESGVLSRIADLFSGRGYNIESLTVAPLIDKAFSRLTIVTTGNDAVVEQITKQLNRLIPIIKVIDVPSDELISRELILCKICGGEDVREKLFKIAEMFDAKIIDANNKQYTLQALGDERSIDSLIEMLKPLGIKEFVRSGKVALSGKISLQTAK